MKVPRQLQDPNFRFCALNIVEDPKEGKNPKVNPNWARGLTLSELETHILTNPKASDKRYGIIGGYGNLIFVDVDKKGGDFEKLIELMDKCYPETFTVETGRGGRHYYFFCENAKNRTFKNSGGEIRGPGYMVVAPGSELCGTEYKVIRDNQIQTIEYNDLLKNLDSFLTGTKTEILRHTNNLWVNTDDILGNKRDHKLQALLRGDETGYPSRSEAEMALVIKLVYYGLTKEQIWEIMGQRNPFGKWIEQPESYRELTYSKAIGFSVKKDETERPDVPFTKEIKKSKLPIVTARQIMMRKKDRRFIVERFLLPKTINMLYSRPGAFKSYLTLDMCLCVAGGDDWLGMKTKKTNVLILDKENSDSSLRDRLIALVSGHGWKRKSNPRYLNMLIRQGDLWNAEFIANLSQYVSEKKVGLIVFDTVRRFGDFEENSSDSINQLYLAFQSIVNGTDCAVLFLHHANKESGKYRGSVDLLGQVDTAYRVERDGTQDDFKLICEKSRSGEIDEIAGHIEFAEERTVITRQDITEKIEGDSYAKFKATRALALSEIAKICPMASSVFVRATLWAEIDSLNVDKSKDDRVSLRTLARVLEHLVKSKYLAKTGAKGEYRRLFSGNGGIFTPQGAINNE